MPTMRKITADEYNRHTASGHAAVQLPLLKEDEAVSDHRDRTPNVMLVSQGGGENNKFAQYPTYKESSIVWAREIPEHWLTVRVKSIFEIKKQIAGSEGYDVLSITQHGIKVKNVESGDGQLSADYSKYQIVEVGDFAMNHMDLLTGYIDISSTSGVTSPDYRVFSLRNGDACLDKYYLRVFQLCYKYRLFYALGQGSSHLGRWRLPTDEFNNFELPFPPLPEQRAIAAFLDAETARTDTLIAKQEELIALLEEKRRAVISHAVTKGLNADAPMKDSGVPWLGEVPAHWEVKRIKNALVDARNGVWGDEPSENNSLLCVRVADFRRKNFTVSLDSPTYRAIADKEREGRLLQRNDLLLEKSGGGDNQPVGFVVIYEHDEPAVCSNFVARLLLKPSSHSRYLLYCFAKLYSARVNVRSIKQNTGIQNLDAGQYFDEQIAFPPPAEQRSIAAFLDAETERIDTLIIKSQHLIALLSEHRTALIAAAVTGQIDVRGVEV
ncbi:MAG: type restriction/modification system, specificity subunit [Chloroflexota bacterium]|jgi:type I restriction enzyme S subunit